MASASVRKRDRSVRVIYVRWLLVAVVFGLVGCPVAPENPDNENNGNCGPAAASD